MFNNIFEKRLNHNRTFHHNYLAFPLLIPNDNNLNNLLIYRGPIFANLSFETPLIRPCHTTGTSMLLKPNICAFKGSSKVISKLSDFILSISIISMTSLL